MNANELKAQIDASIKRIGELTDVAAANDQVLQWFKAVSKFHKYSFFNCCLIMAQNPDATRVAGYQAWVEMHRYVKSGEHGIPILAPIFSKEDAADPHSKRVLCGFRVVYVFDVSQTDGEPLPDPPDWKSEERQPELQQRLLDFCASKGWTVEISDLDHALGYSKGKQIVLDTSAGVSTLAHEIAHSLMHTERFLNRETCETEAEAVSWVVCDHFGLDSQNQAVYLALWHADSQGISKSLERIRQAAMEIIEAVEKQGASDV
jgi:hypothetical protein